jgi:hypothetical protein
MVDYDKIHPARSSEPLLPRQGFHRVCTASLSRFYVEQTETEPGAAFLMVVIHRHSPYRNTAGRYTSNGTSTTTIWPVIAGWSVQKYG